MVSKIKNIHDEKGEETSVKCEKPLVHKNACIYRLGTNFGHFQALFNVLRFSQTFPAKFTCIQLLHILSIIKH